MLKKTITYTDYNDNERTEDFYFSLSKPELIRMETSQEGGYSALLDKIIKSKDVPFIMENFEKIIAKAYGIKSEDGRQIKKSDDISDSFMQSPAYDVLLTEILTNPEELKTFITKILPADMQDKVGNLAVSK